MERRFMDEFFSEATRITRDISREAVQEAIELLFTAWKGGHAVYAVGNGGSASTASHFACDLAKCTIVPNRPRFRVMSLCDNAALVSAWTNDHGFGSVFSGQLAPWIRQGDVLVAYSVHGGSGDGKAGPWSQNLVKAVRLAKEQGAAVLGFSGFGGGALAELADVCVVVPIATEPLGTPLVESFHVVLHHLICTTLRQKIEATAPEKGHLS